MELRNKSKRARPETEPEQQNLFEFCAFLVSFVVCKSDFVIPIFASHHGANTAKFREISQIEISLATLVLYKFLLGEMKRLEALIFANH
jgi:hypothetical protein